MPHDDAPPPPQGGRRGIEASGLLGQSGGYALARREHLVDETVLHRFASVEDLVAVDVAIHLLDGAVGVRPFRWTASCWGFDQALGVLIIEVDGAAVAES